MRRPLCPGLPGRRLAGAQGRAPGWRGRKNPDVLLAGDHLPATEALQQIGALTGYAGMLSDDVLLLSAHGTLQDPDPAVDPFPGMAPELTDHFVVAVPSRPDATLWRIVATAEEAPVTVVHTPGWELATHDSEPGPIVFGAAPTKDDHALKLAVTGSEVSLHLAGDGHTVADWAWNSRTIRLGQEHLPHDELGDFAGHMLGFTRPDATPLVESLRGVADPALLDQVLTSTTGDPAAIVGGLVRGIGLPPEVGAHLLGGPSLTEHPGREVVHPSESLRWAVIEDVKSSLDDTASLTPAGRRRRWVWVLLQLLLVPPLIVLWLRLEWQQGEGLPWFVIVPLLAWGLALPFAGWELSRLVRHHRNQRQAVPNGGPVDLAP